MSTMTTKDAARGFSEVVSRVAYARERLILTRRGRPLAAIVPIEDLEELETRRATEAADQGENT
jgi:prevent-host-death family protein